MSIFGKIRDAIFGSKPEARTPPPTPASTPTAASPAKAPAPASIPATTASESRAIPVLDVTNSLDSMPGADRLNWRTSIVDLMKLINVDSDYESRKALAEELGSADYTGTAEDNVWLHQRVMRELAAHGGEVPPEFRD